MATVARMDQAYQIKPNRFVEKRTGKRHFDLSEEDRIAAILEHPLPHYTSHTEEGDADDA